MDKEKLMDLVNTDFDKFQLEIKRIYKEEYVVSLEQQVKKQKEVIEENKKLKEKNNKLELLIESLELGVTLNQEQEELLDKVLFGGDNNE